MANSISATGNCLCGAVTIHATVATELGACHCGMCNHWSGGPLLSVNAMGTPTFDGAENISIYNSSEWADRAFCKCCGSHLFYRLKGDAPSYEMPIGLFDNLQGIHFKTQIYIDTKPYYYEFANNTDNKTAQQLTEEIATLLANHKDN